MHRIRFDGKERRNDIYVALPASIYAPLVNTEIRFDLADDILGERDLRQQHRGIGCMNNIARAYVVHSSLLEKSSLSLMFFK